MFSPNPPSIHDPRRLRSFIIYYTNGHIDEFLEKCIIIIPKWPQSPTDIMAVPHKFVASKEIRTDLFALGRTASALYVRRVTNKSYA